jgi:hypothetical protein
VDACLCQMSTQEQVGNGVTVYNVLESSLSQHIMLTCAAQHTVHGLLACLTSGCLAACPWSSWAACLLVSCVSVCWVHPVEATGLTTGNNISRHLQAFQSTCAPPTRTAAQQTSPTAPTSATSRIMRPFAAATVALTPASLHHFLSCQGACSLSRAALPTQLQAQHVC